MNQKQKEQQDKVLLEAVTTISNILFKIDPIEVKRCKRRNRNIDIYKLLSGFIIVDQISGERNTVHSKEELFLSIIEELRPLIKRINDNNFTSVILKLEDSNG